MALPVPHIAYPQPKNKKMSVYAVCCKVVINSSCMCYGTLVELIAPVESWMHIDKCFTQQQNLKQFVGTAGFQIPGLMSSIPARNAMQVSGIVA